jgi:hypothetical protein
MSIAGVTREPPAVNNAVTTILQGQRIGWQHGDIDPLGEKVHHDRCFVGARVTDGVFEEMLLRERQREVYFGRALGLVVELSTEPSEDFVVVISSMPVHDEYVAVSMLYTGLNLIPEDKCKDLLRKVKAIVETVYAREIHSHDIRVFIDAKAS